MVCEVPQHKKKGTGVLCTSDALCPKTAFAIAPKGGPGFGCSGSENRASPLHPSLGRNREQADHAGLMPRRFT
jgi:hypothetical protein